MSVICDFCSSPDVKWSYPARDFEAIKDLAGSEGGWAACDVCHAMIEADDYRGVAQRSALRFVRKHGLPPAVIAEVRRSLTKLYDQFEAARTGPVEPFEEES